MKTLLLALWCTLAVAAEPLKIVYFSGQYCGTCAAMEPVWREFARNRPDAVYVDVDKTESAVYRRYAHFWEQEREMPAVYWIRDGKVVRRKAGLLSLPQLRTVTKELSR